MIAEALQLVPPPQPASASLQLPQERRAAATKLMQDDDGGFTKESECLPVLLFTSSLNVVDSYLAIDDNVLRTTYMKGFLYSRSSSGCHLPPHGY